MEIFSIGKNLTNEAVLDLALIFYQSSNIGTFSIDSIIKTTFPLSAYKTYSKQEDKAIDIAFCRKYRKPLLQLELLSTQNLPYHVEKLFFFR